MQAARSSARRATPAVSLPGGRAALRALRPAVTRESAARALRPPRARAQLIVAARDLVRKHPGRQPFGGRRRFHTVVIRIVLPSLVRHDERGLGAGHAREHLLAAELQLALLDGWQPTQPGPVRRTVRQHGLCVHRLRQPPRQLHPRLPGRQRRQLLHHQPASGGTASQRARRARTIVHQPAVAVRKHAYQ